MSKTQSQKTHPYIKKPKKVFKTLSQPTNFIKVRLDERTEIIFDKNKETRKSILRAIKKYKEHMVSHIPQILYKNTDKTYSKNFFL